MSLFPWASQVKQAPLFVEIYEGFTMDVSNIESVKMAKSDAIVVGEKWYVTVTKSDGTRTQVIETQNKANATAVYKRLNTIAEAIAQKIREALAMTPETTIIHEGKKCQT